MFAVKPPKPLTGKHVLAMLLAFFGIMLAVNIFFTVVAVKSFRGEDVPRSYRQGLEYNQTLAAREEQVHAGWTAKVNTVSAANGTNRILIEIDDKEGRGIPALKLNAKLRHPVDTDFDRTLNFTDLGDGRYAATLASFKGHWQFEANAQQNDFVFKIRHELWEN